MSNAILTADITQISASQMGVSGLGAGNERMRLMYEALANPVWSPANVAEQKLATVQKPLLFQVCMVENVGRSKLSQLEDLSHRMDPKTQRTDRLSTSKKGLASEDGSGNAKTMSNRQLITSVDVDTDSPTYLVPQTGEKSIYKLTLQDKSGAMYFAINLSPMNFLKNDGSSCILGSKIVVLPGTIFNRGMFMLRDSSLKFMGGMIQSWNRGRDYKLCEYLAAQLESRTGLTATRKRKTPTG
ncbi:LADA_0D06128g1_1 [Lachancea dasiensis]|uniref:LADA_0D06128g1_1 n=1 Tax=Lachancea dasiensis TaxID=1072105 RepID=A0A1G4J5S9_9SACH|nr:LADA_0D06128g1_1 [Lachancea dasiensis]